MGNLRFEVWLIAWDPSKGLDKIGLSEIGEPPSPGLPRDFPFKQGEPGTLKQNKDLGAFFEGTPFCGLV